MIKMTAIGSDAATYIRTARAARIPVAACLDNDGKKAVATALALKSGIRDNMALT